ncbi:MAG: hypothetical protein KIS81_09270 [Maricaulaceae bacterium]|nr:hypothetical protein [Maricaulaceae bacterium]
MRLIVTLAAALLLAAPALAQGVTLRDRPPIFVTPEYRDLLEEPESGETPVVPAEAAEEDTPRPFAPPHLTARAYLALRAEAAAEGEPAPALRQVWRVERFSLGGAQLEPAAERTLVIGDGFVSDSGRADPVIYDFLLARILTPDPEARTFVNRSIHGDVRRRMDHFIAFTRGGSLDEIAFGPELVFDRFWLEADMGLRMQAAEVVIARSEGEVRVSTLDDDVLVYALPVDAGAALNEDEDAERDQVEAVAPATAPMTGLAALDIASLLRGDAEAVATARATPAEDDETPAPGPDEAPEPESAADARARALFLAWMRHALPVHPDALAVLQAEDSLPERFEFVVFSPNSPQGRREVWTLASSTSEANPAFPLNPAARPRLPGGPYMTGRIGPVMLAAVREQAGGAPGPDTFLGAINAARARGALDHAYLIAWQETAHSGPCPPEAVARPICAEAGRIAAAALGNADFEALFGALAALPARNHARAVAGLTPYLGAPGLAGAAAALIVANELAAWGEEGAEEYPDLDPAGLMADALEADPYAPMIYARLGEMLIGGADYAGAWAVFDLGRSVPAAADSPMLAHVELIEANLELLAPEFFAHATPGR